MSKPRPFTEQFLSYWPQMVQNRVSLTSFDVAMATIFGVTMTSSCSLVKFVKVCTKRFS